MENKQNRLRNVVENVRTNVRQGWNRLVGVLGLENVRERWNNGTILGETIAEAGVIADVIDGAVDKWNGRGDNFRERLTNTINIAGQGLRDQFNRFTTNVGNQIASFEDDVTDLGLGTAVGMRVNDAAIAVREMAVDTYDFISEIPLRGKIFRNKVRAEIETSKTDSLSDIKRSLKTRHAEVVSDDSLKFIELAFENMDKRFNYFESSAKDASDRLEYKIRARENMRMLRSMRKINNLKQQPMSA
ncbi:hypothetical protein KBC75_02160 [Candidatus Shapirobacteria bacterium]|nr:hypothetical protein [Candidatus Shapirobacteria bacterium]